jgi:hypothetical protein
MNYSNLDLGIDYLPYWDDETDISESETSDSETSNEQNNIDLPF